MLVVVVAPVIIAGFIKRQAEKVAAERAETETKAPHLDCLILVAVVVRENERGMLVMAAPV